MLRLDEDLGFKEHFSQENIDTLKRLAPDTTNSAAYKLYKKKVKIGYDPTEGIVRMEVIAADPETSALFAERLVAYAEERVDNISLRVREDAMKGARESYEAAEAERVEALSRVTRLQESLGVLDPAAANALLQSEMQQLQSLLLEKELTLASLLDNRRPNQARVDGTRAEIRRLEEKIADVQAQMTSTGAMRTTKHARMQSCAPLKKTTKPARPCCNNHCNHSKRRGSRPNGRSAICQLPWPLFPWTRRAIRASLRTPFWHS